MGGLSPMHLGLVLVIALLVFGPKKLPEIGRELGQAIREFKRASREVVDSFHEAADVRPHPTYEYDSYASPPYDPAGHPTAPVSPAPEQNPQAAEGPSIPSGPPPGTVDRSAVALATPPAGEGAVGAASVEPAREPAAAPERNT
jgi:sec-independent protein translocase protein TatA